MFEIIFGLLAVMVFLLMAFWILVGSSEYLAVLLGQTNRSLG